MPPTRGTYTPLPYIGGASLGQLLQLQAQHRAEAEQRSGEIAAQAWANVGQNISNAITGYAKEKEQAPLKAAQLVRTQQENQLGQLRLSEAQRADLDASRQRGISSAMDAALKGSMVTDPATGITTYDRNKLLANMTEVGVPQTELAKYGPVLDAADAAVKNLKTAHLEALKHSANLIEMAGNDPAVFRGEIDRGISNGLFTKAEAQPYLDAAEKDPTHIGRITGSLLGRDPNAGQFTLNPGDVRYGPDGKQIVTNPKEPTPVSTQSKDVLLDGKPALVTFDPQARKYFDASGADVSARVRPMPPASVQVNAQNAAAASNLPAWATDASRPSGPDANKIDPRIGLTPNGLHQAALTYLSTGSYPPVGRGNGAIPQAVRSAVLSKVGAIAAEAGMDEPTFRAFYKANASSLTQQQKIFDQAQSNITTADRNVVELDKVLAKLPDTGSPLFNKPLRAFAKSVTGDQNMGPIATYLSSVQNEYGKIINSSNGSSVLTDSARHEAQQLLDPNATVAQMLGSIQALKTEGGNRLLSVGDQIQRIQQRMTVGEPQQPAASGGPKEGDTKPIDGFPGTEQQFRNGKWIRTK